MVGSVLIYSMGEVIGDGLIKLPFLSSVRAAFPDSRLTWCAAKVGTVYTGPLKPVVEGLLDEVIDTGVTGARASDFFTLRRPFGGRRFDLVIDTQTNVRRTLTVKRSARRLISPAASFRFSDVKPSGAYPEALVDRLQALLSLAVGRPVAPRAVPLVNARAIEAAEQLLPSGPRYIGFAPGAGGQNKRWPLDSYLAMAATQIERGRQPVLLVGPDEVEIAEAVRGRLPQALIPELDRRDGFADIRGPLLVIALARRLAAAVANDAGPGHMLAAGGAPLLSLQKERRKATKFHPAAQRLHMLIAEDFGGLEMGLIPVSAADQALESLLAGTG